MYDKDFEFVKKGYLDNKGNIRENLLTIEAEQIANSFYKVKNSQLRAFFNEIKILKNKINEDEKKWDEIYPMVLMIKSKVVYRCSRNKEIYELKKFLMESIKYIQDQNKLGKGYETFKVFVIFFETIVGYSYKPGNK